MGEIGILLLLSKVFIAVKTGLFVYYVLEDQVTDEELLEAKTVLQKREQDEREKKYKKFFFRNENSYERAVVYLNQTGVSFRLGNRITPSQFEMVKIAASFLFFIFGFVSGWLGLGILMAVIGWFFPSAVFQFLNNRDNEKMMDDIKSVYDTLLISMESGVFLTEAFADSYKMVNHSRLKRALLELNSDIVATNEMEEAISKFEMKFKNQYISNLCIILRQSVESGLSVQMLSDLSNQITDVTKAMAAKKKEKLDGEGTKVELLLFVGIIAVCLYITLNTFANTMSQL